MLADTWIIEYRSPSYTHPIFSLWYMDTDKDRTEKFMTFKTGEIFATTSLTDLKSRILDNINDIDTYDNLPQWLQDFDLSAPAETTLYNMHELLQAVSTENFGNDILSGLINFINLFVDYVCQDEANEHLRVYADNEYLREAWEYGYNMIVWPGVLHPEKFEVLDKQKPPLEIDAVKLKEGLEQLMEQFEQQFKIAK